MKTMEQKLIDRFKNTNFTFSTQSMGTNKILFIEWRNGLSVAQVKSFIKQQTISHQVITTLLRTYTYKILSDNLARYCQELRDWKNVEIKLRGKVFYYQSKEELDLEQNINASYDIKTLYKKLSNKNLKELSNE